ncbi:hypothetical protein TRFO_34800 [Tritrichomonas foetus]|uniref:Uncharacterized protein n=1 Tax=Tritrichomonas foetus TaxID=1144522 RepID=A0A1J4JI80_9EUKA|nr:hypothetical protein TRFO_34800 [Tritrichomonas foetus]|eukprot:OHS98888.1 hypothetical protein TRFO_34800 [Tritrichomonas foetus]
MSGNNSQENASATEGTPEYDKPPYKEFIQQPLADIFLIGVAKIYSLNAAIQYDCKTIYKEMPPKFTEHLLVNIENYQWYLHLLQKMKLHRRQPSEDFKLLFDQIVKAEVTKQFWDTYERASKNFKLHEPSKALPKEFNDNMLAFQKLYDITTFCEKLTKKLNEKFNLKYNPTQIFAIFPPTKLLHYCKIKGHEKLLEILLDQRFFNDLTKQNFVARWQNFLNSGIEINQLMEFYMKLKPETFKMPEFVRSFDEEKEHQSHNLFVKRQASDESSDEQPSKTFAGVNKPRDKTKSTKKVRKTLGRREAELFESTDSDFDPDPDSDEKAPLPAKTSLKPRTKQKITKTVILKNSEKVQKDKKDKNKKLPPLSPHEVPDEEIAIDIRFDELNDHHLEIQKDCKFYIPCYYEGEKRKLKVEQPGETKKVYIRYFKDEKPHQVFIINNHVLYQKLKRDDHYEFDCNCDSIWFGQYDRPVMSLNLMKRMSDADDDAQNANLKLELTYQALKICIPHIENVQLLQIAFCYASTMYNLFESATDKNENYGLDLLNDIVLHPKHTFEMSMTYLSIYYSAAIEARTRTIELFTEADRMAAIWAQDQSIDKHESEKDRQEAIWWENRTLTLAKIAIRFASSLLTADGQKFRNEEWNNDPFKQYMPKWFIAGHSIDADHLDSGVRFFITPSDVVRFNQLFHEVLEHLNQLLTNEFTVEETHHPCFKAFVAPETKTYIRASIEPKDEATKDQMKDILKMVQKIKFQMASMDAYFYPSTLFSETMNRFLMDNDCSPLHPEKPCFQKFYQELQQYANTHIMMQPLFRETQTLIHLEHVQFSVPAKYVHIEEEAPEPTPERSHSPPRISTKRPNRAGSGKTPMITSSVQAPPTTSASQPTDPKEVALSEEEISQNFDL